MRYKKGSTFQVNAGAVVAISGDMTLAIPTDGDAMELPKFAIMDCEFDGAETFDFGVLMDPLRSGHSLKEVVMHGLYLGPGAGFAIDAGKTLASMSGVVRLLLCEECQKVMPGAEDGKPIHSEKDADYCKAWRVMCT